MKKLGLLLLALSLGSFAFLRFGGAAFPTLRGLLLMPKSYGWVLAIQAGVGVCGVWLLGASLLLKRLGFGLASVGIFLALPIGVFAHAWGVNRVMPAAIMRLNSRWDGSYLHYYSAEFLDQASLWIMNLDPDRNAVGAVRFHLALGGYLQRMGRVPEAIEHLERAHAITLRKGSKAAESQAKVARALGVAYLRAGEIASCLKRSNEQSCIFPLHGTGIWRDTKVAEKAEALFREVLELEPGNPGARWLLALSQEVMGIYPRDIATEDLLPEATMRGETTAPHFRNRAVALGVAGDDLAGSVAVDDFDGDGFQDIITCSYDPNQSLHYYHNQGDGTFVDWTDKAGLRQQKGGLNLTHADFNNDGLLDILVLRGAWFLSAGYQRNALLQQNPDHTFTDVTVAAGMAQEFPSLAATWGDYDLDGYLDVFIGNERITAMGRGVSGASKAAKAGADEKTDHAPSQLFHNNGDGTFTDVAAAAGVQNFRFTRGAAFGDYDNDGYLDLAVSNLSQSNRLYHNNGDGTFTDIAMQPGLEFLQHPTRAFGCWWMDVNNDGNLDLFVAGYPLTDKVNDVVQDRYHGERGRRVDPCALYLGDGHGGFEDATKEWNLDRVHLVMGANFADIDSDGWMDFYLGTGAPSLEIMIPNVLYRNMQGQGFLDATTASGLGHLHKGHGISFSDIDNDGDLDVFAQLGGWYVDSHSQNALFLNEGTGNHSLTLQLVGTEANRFGLGARLRVVVEENGNPRTMHLVSGDTASFGSNAMEQVIGLGQATKVKELEIQWPNLQRSRQIFYDLPADTTLRITEGSASWQEILQSVVPLLEQ